MTTVAWDGLRLTMKHNRNRKKAPRPSLQPGRPVLRRHLHDLAAGVGAWRRRGRPCADGADHDGRSR